MPAPFTPRLGFAFALLGITACPAPEPEPETSPARPVESSPPKVASRPAWGPQLGVQPRAVGVLAAEWSRDLAALDRGGPATGRRDAQALIAAGRIGGSAAVHRVLATLDGPLLVPAATAAAMLEPPRTKRLSAPEPTGLWATLEDALWGRYALTGASEGAYSLLLAIARTGGARSVRRLSADLARLPESDDAVRAMRGLTAVGILCARGFSLDENARVTVEAGLVAMDGRVREASAFAVARCARTSGETFAPKLGRSRLRKRLIAMLASPEPEELRLAWRALAALGEAPPEVPAGVLAEDPPHWTVEVAAVRALAGHPTGRVALYERLDRLDLAGFEGPRFHALLESVRLLRGDRERSLEELESRVQTAWEGSTGRRRRALTQLRCELALRRAIRRHRVAPLSVCESELTPTEFDRLSAVAWLEIGKTKTGGGRFEPLLRAAQSTDPPLAAYALSLLAEVDSTRVNPILRRALDHPDVGVVAAAAGAIAARSRDDVKRDRGVVASLARLIPQLANADAVEARVAAIDALGNLRHSGAGGRLSPDSADGKQVVAVLQALATDPAVSVRRAARHALLGDDLAVARFDLSAQQARSPAFPIDEVEPLVSYATRARGLLVHTSGGSFEIDFRGVSAPRNQANLVKLAENGFFSGRTWHRVVPGFVVQGGDPRGDGYGGPGYLVPSEWSNLEYVRGTVGMAHAGKDTVGSQFFVAHTRQPHLDGRYTVVGQVTNGMNVVDQLLAGDTIDRIEVLVAP